MKPQEVRLNILQVIDRIQGNSANYVSDVGIAEELKITVDEVQGHLEILEQQGRLDYSHSSAGSSAYLAPRHRQQLKEELEASKEEKSMRVTAFGLRQQKIFLSHKGADKPKVRRFFSTLKAIGFEPWLDEDAMAAGTELERGILQGFKDSCAAVFFITPNFVDEGYLRTEVNYAIAEKRAKGDRFAIATIVFTGKKGEKSAVPELLTQFVWKEPATELEALNEILRAMPVEPGEPRWRT